MCKLKQDSQKDVRGTRRNESISKLKPIELDVIGLKTCEVVFPAPLELYGEGNYAISDVKEVKATEAFLELDVQTKRCQEKESIEACSSRLHLSMIRKQCQCIPLNLLNTTNIEV